MRFITLIHWDPVQSIYGYYRQHFSSFPWLFQAGLASSAPLPPSCSQLARITCSFFFSYLPLRFFSSSGLTAAEMRRRVSLALPATQSLTLKVTAKIKFHVTNRSLKLKYKISLRLKYLEKHQSSNVIKAQTMMENYITVNIKINRHGTQFLRNITAGINLLFITLNGSNYDYQTDI